MNKKCSILFGLLAFVTSIHAQDDGQKFRIYGFADMYMEKNFLKDNSLIKASGSLSDDFTASLSHLNIYSDFNPNDRIRMLMELGYQQQPVTLKSTQGQIFIAEGIRKDTLKKAEPLPSNIESVGVNKTEWGSFSVERAVFQVKFNQQFNLLFGKFITPSGIWNVDHGSPAIMTIHQPTQFSISQIFPSSQIGIMEEGTAFLGDADINYSVYASTGRKQLAIEEPKDIAVGGQVRVNLPLLNEFRLGFAGYTGINKEELSYMNIIIDSSTIKKLQQQAISEAMSGSIKMSDIPSRVSQLISQEAKKPDNYSFTSTENYKYRENVISGNMKLKYQGVGLQSEISYQIANNLFLEDKQSKVLAYYGLLSYDAIKKNKISVTPYFCFEHIKMKDGQNNPSVMLSGDICGYELYFLGINTKIFDNFGFKFEWVFSDILTTGALANYSDNADFSSLCGQFTIAF